MFSDKKKETTKAKNNNQENQEKVSRRIKLQGIVVSDKMDKTIVVKVERFKMHPKYKKRYKVSKKYKVHDPKKEAKIGDQVIFQQCRPLSKEKRWELIKIITKH